MTLAILSRLGFSYNLFHHRTRHAAAAFDFHAAICASPQQLFPARINVTLRPFRLDLNGTSGLQGNACLPTTLEFFDPISREPSFELPSFDGAFLLDR